MTTSPSWLPDLFSMNGIWDERLAELYNIFKRDFELGKPYLDEFEVWWNRTVVDGNYPEAFWHITTKGIPSERLPDFRRAELLPWCCPSILNFDDPIILFWDYFDGERTRTYLWLNELDYVIVFEKRRQKKGVVAFLITAFYVEGDRRRKQLRNKYNLRIHKLST